MLTGVIFCGGDSFFAKQIEEITKEPDQHVALLFDDTLVLHYTVLGFQTAHIRDFPYKIHCILKSPIDNSKTAEEVIERHKKGAYDFLAVLYIALYKRMKTWFGITLAGNTNQWQNKKKKFCVEFASEESIGVINSTWTPYYFRLELERLGWKRE